MTHRLRQAYIAAIQDQYGICIWGDKYPEKTEMLAQRIDRLGISYEMFVAIGIQLWADWAEEKNHKYVYWNMVMSETTFERIGGYLELTRDLDVPDVNPVEFSAELQYATAYIEWWRGKISKRPRHANITPSIKVKILVAEYLCRLHGIVFRTSNYNDIAEQLNG